VLGETIQEQIAREEAFLARQPGLWPDGSGHIPIEAAMKKLAGKLPHRDGDAVEEFYRAPSRSSSGQKARREP
jgi:hypothetical protein